MLREIFYLDKPFEKTEDGAWQALLRGVMWKQARF